MDRRGVSFATQETELRRERKGEFERNEWDGGVVGWTKTIGLTRFKIIHRELVDPYNL